MNNVNSQILLPDFFSMFGSFVLVLILLGIVLFILKKVQMTNSVNNHGRQIQILEVTSTSNKQKIMLLKVDNQKILVGLSGQNMSQLGHWTISENTSSNAMQNSSNTSNADRKIDNVKINSKNLVTEKNDSSNLSNHSKSQFNNLEKVSDIKQTENLLKFAKKIRGSLNQSINKAQRAQ